MPGDPNFLQFFVTFLDHVLEPNAIYSDKCLNHLHNYYNMMKNLKEMSIRELLELGIRLAMELRGSSKSSPGLKQEQDLSCGQVR
jgi:hypothetical protein